MRKLALTIAILLACVACFLAGKASGVHHAIFDSEMWAVERYDPADPSASAWGDYDLRVFIELDGDVYIHGMYQG